MAINTEQNWVTYFHSTSWSCCRSHHTSPNRTCPEEGGRMFPPKRSKNLLYVSLPNRWTEKEISPQMLARSGTINTRLYFMASEVQWRNGSKVYKETLFREKLHSNSTVTNLT